MHGAIIRHTMTKNSKDLGVTPITEGGNMVKTANGRYAYEKSLDEVYAGNPYFEKSVKEAAEGFTGLQKSVPEDRQMQNNDNMEAAFKDSLGHGYSVRRKQTLDDLYAGNPYYRPAIP